MPVHIYPRPPAAKAKALLIGCNLPASDLNDGHFEHFFGCGAEDAPKGVVGVELHGELGLLRSLAVDAAVRGRGCGRRLVAEAEQHAARLGVESLYLLTTTAEEFFRGLGYATIARELAPEAIRKTQEFSRLCPTSSVVMVKRLSAGRA